jgi:hypothetical protein
MGKLDRLPDTLQFAQGHFDEVLSVSPSEMRLDVDA